VPPEVCDNGADDNGNGLIDCQDPQCDGVTFGACDTGNQGVCSAGTLTCDGSAIGPACVQDQAAGTEGPFGDATCGDGLDNDCDGLTDAADPDCDEPDLPKISRRQCLTRPPRFWWDHSDFRNIRNR